MIQTSVATHVFVAPGSWVRSAVDIPGGAYVAVGPDGRQETAVDEALAESFPASDPPAWNPGIARPRPAGGTQARLTSVQRVAVREERDAVGRGVIDVSRRGGSERTLAKALVSLAGAAGIALLVPAAILLLGMPAALTVRGLVEAVRWLSTVFR